MKCSSFNKILIGSPQGKVGTLYVGFVTPGWEPIKVRKKDNGILKDAGSSSACGIHVYEFLLKTSRKTVFTTKLNDFQNSAGKVW